MISEATIENELRYFASDEQRNAFRQARVAAHECLQSWQYSSAQHRCTVVATDGKTQIVHCATGFGPAFPWSVQSVGEKDLGFDSEWFAYLYEAFVCSSMWPAGRPNDFELMGPGERSA
jgi:hypothetical protein